MLFLGNVDAIGAGHAVLAVVALAVAVGQAGELILCIKPHLLDELP